MILENHKGLNSSLVDAIIDTEEAVILMKEATVNLNVQEVGIIISALQLLELRDERYIAREYGSSTVLYNKFETLMNQMDSSETGLQYDEDASF